MTRKEFVYFLIDKGAIRDPIGYELNTPITLLSNEHTALGNYESLFYVLSPIDTVYLINEKSHFHIYVSKLEKHTSNSIAVQSDQLPSKAHSKFTLVFESIS